MEMHPKVQEAAIGTIESFQEFLGREAVDDDPLFLGMLLYSDEESEEKTVKTLKYAFGVPDEDLYAYEKLGYLVTKDNRKHATRKELNAWDLAKQEYFDIQNGKFQNKEDYTETLTIELGNWHVRLIYLYALLIFKLKDKISPTFNFNNNVSVDQYILFCITKNLKTLMAIRVLSAHNFNEDALNLFRSIYENYLQITTAAHNSNQMQNELDAKIGLQKGTHEFKDGKIFEKKS